MRISVLPALLLFSLCAQIGADPEPAFVIPNLQAWSQVQPGLPVDELEKLLGKPFVANGPKGDWKPQTVYAWTYGYAARKSPVLPRDLSFMVHLEMGKVRSKEDPFGGVPLSQDGSPTVPKLMAPANDTVFDHYPRFMDFRWYAASGDYPMKYEIEINILSPKRGWLPQPEQAVDGTYYSYLHTGANHGRWRIRAVNAKGKSEWSEHSFFEFTR